MKKKTKLTNKDKITLQKGKPLQPVKTSQGKSNKKLQLGMILCILILTFIAFYPTLKNSFVDTWDDADYVTDNRNIQSLSNFKKIVTTPVQGNYHPLTMITLALNYAWTKKDASSYHAANLVLHLLNTILVFFFIFRLTRKKYWIAFIVALFFGIHPLHVESVAWVAERKDVLYSFFFLFALIFYLKYLEKNKLIRILPVLGFFILSLLSKPAAVIFPLVLLAVDYFYGRPGKMSIFYEKIPFFLLSIGMGLLTVHAQSVERGVGVVDAGTFPVHFPFFFGFYGLMMYAFKTIVPVDLCTFYPFPPLNLALPVEYYFSMLFGIGLIAILIMTFKKYKIIAFSIFFYIINLLLVLQFMPVGGAVIADRYTYLPLIGVFIVPAYFFQKWSDKHAGIPPVTGIILLLIVSITLTVLTYKQSKIWKDSASLWDNTIAVQPSGRAYSKRGLAYKDAGNLEKAIELYTKAIGINKNESDALMNRGNLYFDMGKDDLALDDCRKYSLKKKDALVYSNIGIIYGRQGKNDSALFYLNASVALDSTKVVTFLNRGICFYSMKRYEEAIADYRHYLRFKPDDASVILNIGIAYQAVKKHKESIPWFNQAISIKPKKGEYYLKRSYSWFELGDKRKAKEDALKARQLGATVKDIYIETLK